MATVGATDFKYGLDRRRPRSAGAPGTLWDAQNCHITRGGDIESMRKFEIAYTLPPGTFGLAQAAGQLYTFGSANLAVPVGVQYVRCIPEVTANMVRVLSAKAFEGQVYVIAEYDDGMIRHYFNGARVTDWDALADANSTVNTLASYLAVKISTDSTIAALASGNIIVITANVAGRPFTISATAVDKGIVNDQTAVVTTPQPNVPAVSEVQAAASVTIQGGFSNPGVNQITQITAAAQPLLATPVDWVLSNASTAASVAAAINANAAHNGGYTASAIGNVIAIVVPPGGGSAVNGTIISVTATNVDVTSTNFLGGVSAVAAIAQVSIITIGGTYEPKDLYTVTLNGVVYTGTGRASGMGTLVFVYRQRIYCPSNTHLKYCALNNAADWHTAAPSTGAGFIDFSVLMDGSERISGLAVYAGYVAIFLPKTIFIYNLAPDATTDSQVQLIPNTGTIAGLSALQFGLDSFYLDSTGVRSIRARDISNVAITNDIGTVLDPFIQSWINTVGLGIATVAEATIDPFDGRYWISIGTRIFVLSLFTTAQVSAWTYYDIGLVFNSFTRIFNKLYARAGNVIYLYGGASGTAYPAPNAAPISVALPFLSSDSPATFKQWSSFDMACAGAWAVTFLVDPDDETAEIQYGTAVNTTYAGSINSTVGRTPLVAVRFDCSFGGKVTLSSFLAHYDSEGDK